MGRSSRLCVSAVATLVSTTCTDAVSEQTKLIPLDQIWAYYMPGTRDVRELDAIKKSTGVTEHPIVQQILHSLHRSPRETHPLSPAFIVVGIDAQALEKARDVFAKKAKPVSTVPINTGVTLVFYSFVAGRYVHVESVEQTNHSITVKYRLVAHSTGEVTSHFALIPLGKLSEGLYEVKIKQLPPVDTAGKPAKPIHHTRQIVCGGFAFRVGKE